MQPVYTGDSVFFWSLGLSKGFCTACLQVSATFTGGSAVFRFRQHGGEARVYLGLIAFAVAVLLKPGNHIRIESDRHRSYDRPIEFAAAGEFPIPGGRFGDVAGIDL